MLSLLPILALGAFATSQSLTADGVTVTYDNSRFGRVRISEAKAKPAPETPGYEVSPAYLGFCFNCGPSPKAAPNHGSIEVIPLHDRSVKDLSQPYPDLLKDVAALRRLLHDRPELIGDKVRKAFGLPTITNQDAGQIFLSKIRYLDFPWGTGVGFLVQYSQDSSPYAVGGRLDYEIEALSNDGTIGVSAFFRVSHPDLPKTEENEVMGKGGHPTRDEYETYVRKMEHFLDGKTDNSFVPPLGMVQQLVGSLQWSAKADPASWNTSFAGKEVTVARTERALPAK